MDKAIIKVIMDGYKRSTATIKTKDGPTGDIPIGLGVKQGDPLSPILFNLCLDPLLFALESEKAGFEFGEDAEVSVMAFADDLVLLSGSWRGMETNLKILDSFCGKVGLEVNPDKCAAFCIGHQRRKAVLNACPPWTIKRKDIRMLGGQARVKYLGVEIHPCIVRYAKS